MGVIHTGREQPPVVPRLRLGQDALEGVVVAIVVESGELAIGTVEDVIDQAAFAARRGRLMTLEWIGERTTLRVPPRSCSHPSKFGSKRTTEIPRGRSSAVPHFTAAIKVRSKNQFRADRWQVKPHGGEFRQAGHRQAGTEVGPTSKAGSNEPPRSQTPRRPANSWHSSVGSRVIPYDPCSSGISLG